MEVENKREQNKESHVNRIKKRRKKSPERNYISTPEEFVRQILDKDSLYYMKRTEFYRYICDVSGGGQEHIIFNWLSLSIFKNVVESLRKRTNVSENPVGKKMLKKLQRMQFVVKTHPKTYVDRVVRNSKTVSFYHDLNNKVIDFIGQMNIDNYGFNLLNHTQNFQPTLSLVINIHLDVIAVITEIVCNNIVVKIKYDSAQEWAKYKKFQPILEADNPPTHEERRAICVDLIKNGFLTRNQVETMINDVRGVQIRKYERIFENLEKYLDAFMNTYNERKIVASHAVSFHQGFFYNTYNDARYTPVDFMQHFSPRYNICVLKTMKPYETYNGNIFTNEEKTLLGQLEWVSAASNEAESKSNFNFPSLRL